MIEDHAAFRGALAFMLNLRLGRHEGRGLVRLPGRMPRSRGPPGGHRRRAVEPRPARRGRDGPHRDPAGANPSVKVLILSASIESGLSGRMAEAGADGVLNKTTALTEIAAAVVRLSGGRR
jgi:hypothetical protein